MTDEHWSGVCMTQNSYPQQQPFFFLSLDFFALAFSGAAGTTTVVFGRLPCLPPGAGTSSIWPIFGVSMALGTIPQSEYRLTKLSYVIQNIPSNFPPSPRSSLFMLGYFDHSAQSSASSPLYSAAGFAPHGFRNCTTRIT